MTHQDVLYLLLAENGVVDMQRGATRVSENVIHAGVLERPYQDIAAGELFTDVLTLVCAHFDSCPLVNQMTYQPSTRHP